MNNSNCLLNLFLLCLTLITWQTGAQEYNVLKYGAKGDGKASDTNAVRAALAAAAKSNGGRVVFDAGNTFLTGCFNVTSNVILDVRGTIMASVNVSDYEVIQQLPWYGNITTGIFLTKQPVVYILNATNVTITGGGVINGNGPIWYNCSTNNDLNDTIAPCHPYGRPRLVQPTYSTDIVINNITLKDSPFWTLHLAWTTNVYVTNLKVFSPPPYQFRQAGYGLNTDGVDIDCSVNVTVENSYITTADDAIAVKSGNDWFGRTFGRPSENILVRNLSIDLSNGLAVGSEMSGGARNITFQDITLNGSWNAIILKTTLGRGGFIEDVTYKNIYIKNAVNNESSSYQTSAIQLNMNYDLDDTTSSVPPETIPSMKNIYISDIVAENVNYAYFLYGSSQNPIQNVHLSNITVTNLTSSIAKHCYNIGGVCDKSSVKPACPPCMIDTSVSYAQCPSSPATSPTTSPSSPATSPKADSNAAPSILQSSIAILLSFMLSLNFIFNSS